ncbi:MAG: nitroreductase family protein [Candidatus Omnitrophica bacterium]|nr:nitroreductase family protein [Candidatus Omnitrophota bacterium]
MDILSFLKKATAIRRFSSTDIKEDDINRIIQAGIWGPSIHGFQPWKFIIIQNKNVIFQISQVILIKSKKLHIGYNTLLKHVARTVENSNVLIPVYNTRTLSKQMFKVGRRYGSCGYLSEIQAISAAVQNIILVANSLNIGACWLVMPTFCHTSINRILNEEDELVAIVALGYPAQKGRRSKRVNINSIVTFIK